MHEQEVQHDQIWPLAPVHSVGGEFWAQRGEIRLQLRACTCEDMVVLYVSSRDRVTHHAAAG